MLTGEPLPQSRFFTWGKVDGVVKWNMSGGLIGRVGKEGSGGDGGLEDEVGAGGLDVEAATVEGGEAGRQLLTPRQGHLNPSALRAKEGAGEGKRRRERSEYGRRGWR